jgi:hypothetical protein
LWLLRVVVGYIYVRKDDSRYYITADRLLILETIDVMAYQQPNMNFIEIIKKEKQYG